MHRTGDMLDLKRLFCWELLKSEREGSSAWLPPFEILEILRLKTKRADVSPESPAEREPRSAIGQRSSPL